VPGVYTNWGKAQEQIKGFARPRYKKFATREEAEEFVKMGQSNSNGASFAGNSSEIQKLSGAPGIMSDTPKGEQGVPMEPGDGPLPPGAEDGFDPNLLLDPKTGKVVYKLKEQKSATKTKATGPPGMLRIYTDGSALKNGRALASAGVGVYFGPGDNRFVSLFLPAGASSNPLVVTLLMLPFLAEMSQSPSKAVARRISAQS
jgi:ribonuclease HI